MMSAKLADSGLPKRMAFWNKVYDVIILSMTSPAKFCHVIQIILQMRSCGQSLVTQAILWKKLSQPQFYNDLTRNNRIFEGSSWFKFNNLGLALGTKLKFYTSVAKGFKLKVRKFSWIIPTFAEVTGEKLVGGDLFGPPSSIGLKMLFEITVKCLINLHLRSIFLLYQITYYCIWR